MTETAGKHEAGQAWQVGVWDRMVPVYAQDVDCRRFWWLIT